MGQERRVEGSGPHNSHPAAKGATPGQGDDVPAREPMAITPGHGQKRRVKGDQWKDLETLWTSHGGTTAFAATQPSAQASLRPSVSLLAGVSAPGLSEQDKQQRKQHRAQIPTHGTSVTRILSLMQRPAAEDPLEVTLSPREGRGEAALGLEEQLGDF